MNFHLLITNRAIKDIEKLDKIIKERIGKTLLHYVNNPHEYSERLTNSKLGNYRFRIGDYRVIFDIDGYNLVILRVGHRKEVYRKLK